MQKCVGFFFVWWFVSIAGERIGGMSPGLRPDDALGECIDIIDVQVYASVILRLARKEKPHAEMRGVLFVDGLVSLSCRRQLFYTQPLQARPRGVPQAVV